MNGSPITVGVDVGAPKKGFHAVALVDGRYHSYTASADPLEIARWCRELHPTVIAVDAPSAWNLGSGRQAERDLRRRGMNCFVTPTLDQARAHPKGWYDWMLAGAALYDALEPSHPRYDGHRRDGVAVETFPHAVACALARRIVAAKDKLRERRALLDALPLDTRNFRGIDQIDAALCAWTAHLFAQGHAVCLGDAQTGFIVTPAWPEEARR